jgi:hypothetical protein
MGDTVTVNKTVKEPTFLKYKILIERVEVIPATRKEWVRISDTGPRNYDYAPEYDAIEFNSTKALEMEVREEIDLRRVVKALLWEAPDGV